MLEQLPLAMPHLSRDDAMVSHGNEPQSPQDKGDRHNIDERPWYGLIQLLRPALSGALPILTPPKRSESVNQQVYIWFNPNLLVQKYLLTVLYTNFALEI